MNCPYCDFTGPRMKLHRHLGEMHLDAVVTEAGEDGRMRYVIQCPLCELKYQHRVKPRYTDAGFLQEFRAEIGLVAFDQLLYHLAEKHSPQANPSPDPNSPPTNP